MTKEEIRRTVEETAFEILRKTDGAAMYEELLSEKPNPSSIDFAMALSRHNTRFTVELVSEVLQKLLM